nr:hypothetical protein HK105_005342 [Polyrhizophydium stewartii]
MKRGARGFSRYAHVMHDSSLMAQLARFLEVVRGWPCYGCSFFPACIELPPSGFFEYRTQNYFIGVNYSGIVVIDADQNKYIYTFVWDNTDWIHGPDSFTIIVRRDDKTKTVPLITPQAPIINNVSLRLKHRWRKGSRTTNLLDKEIAAKAAPAAAQRPAQIAPSAQPQATAQPAPSAQPVVTAQSTQSVHSSAAVQSSPSAQPAQPAQSAQPAWPAQPALPAMSEQEALEEAILQEYLANQAKAQEQAAQQANVVTLADLNRKQPMRPANQPVRQQDTPQKQPNRQPETQQKPNTAAQTIPLASPPDDAPAKRKVPTSRHLGGSLGNLVDKQSSASNSAALRASMGNGLNGSAQNVKNSSQNIKGSKGSVESNGKKSIGSIEMLASATASAFKSIIGKGDKPHGRQRGDTLFKATSQDMGLSNIQDTVLPAQFSIENLRVRPNAASPATETKAPRHDLKQQADLATSLPGQASPTANHQAQASTTVTSKQAAVDALQNLSAPSSTAKAWDSSLVPQPAQASPVPNANLATIGSNGRPLSRMPSRSASTKRQSSVRMSSTAAGVALGSPKTLPGGVPGSSGAAFAQSATVGVTSGAQVADISDAPLPGSPTTPQVIDDSTRSRASGRVPRAFASGSESSSKYKTSKEDLLLAQLDSLNMPRAISGASSSRPTSPTSTSPTFVGPFQRTLSPPSQLNEHNPHRRSASAQPSHQGSISEQSSVGKSAPTKEMTKSAVNLLSEFDELDQFVAQMQTKAGPPAPDPLAPPASGQRRPVSMMPAQRPHPPATQPSSQPFVHGHHKHSAGTEASGISGSRKNLSATSLSKLAGGPNPAAVAPIPVHTQPPRLEKPSGSLGSEGDLIAALPRRQVVVTEITPSGPIGAQSQGESPIAGVPPLLRSNSSASANRTSIVVSRQRSGSVLANVVQALMAPAEIKKRSEGFDFDENLGGGAPAVVVDVRRQPTAKRGPAAQQ